MHVSANLFFFKRFVCSLKYIHQCLYAISFGKLWLGMRFFSKEMALRTPVCQYIDEWLLIYSVATGHWDGSGRYVGLLL